MANRTQKEISTLINRSQAHVSRVEKSIIRRLRKTVLKKNLNFVV
ncbi:sigma factor-like helix-turn-helix DNA-binding protein [Clostridium perfringens]